MKIHLQKAAVSETTQNQSKIVQIIQKSKKKIKPFFRIDAKIESKFCFEAKKVFIMNYFFVLFRFFSLIFASYTWVKYVAVFASVF